MSRRAEVHANGGIQLFPFLAVLICTMGALVVLLFVFAKHGQVQAVKKAVEKRAQEGGGVDAQAELDAILWQIEQLRKARDASEAELADEREKLSHVEDHQRRLLARLDELKISAAELERATVDRSKLQQKSFEELEKARGQAHEAQQAAEKARKDAAQHAKNYSVVPYEGPNSTRRRPFYIECRAGVVVLQPEGIELLPDDFAAYMGPGNALASALRGMREHLSRQAASGKAENPYPLLLVRPDGIEAYYAARAALDSWGSDFGYELVGGDWELKFNEADPQVRDLTQNIVAEARVRQRDFLAAAPPSTRAQPRVTYHARSRGGFSSERRSGGGGGNGRGGWDSLGSNFSKRGSGSARGGNSGAAGEDEGDEDDTGEETGVGGGGTGGGPGGPYPNGGNGPGGSYAGGGNGNVGAGPNGVGGNGPGGPYPGGNGSGGPGGPYPNGGNGPGGPYAAGGSGTGNRTGPGGPGGGNGPGGNGAAGGNGAGGNGPGGAYPGGGNGGGYPGVGGRRGGPVGVGEFTVGGSGPGGSGGGMPGGTVGNGAGVGNGTGGPGGGGNGFGPGGAGGPGGNGTGGPGGNGSGGTGGPYAVGSAGDGGAGGGPGGAPGDGQVGPDGRLLASGNRYTGSGNGGNGTGGGVSGTGGRGPGGNVNGSNGSGGNGSGGNGSGGNGSGGNGSGGNGSGGQYADGADGSATGEANGDGSSNGSGGPSGGLSTGRRRFGAKGPGGGAAQGNAYASGSGGGGQGSGAQGGSGQGGGQSGGSASGGAGGSSGGAGGSGGGSGSGSDDFGGGGGAPSLMSGGPPNPNAPKGKAKRTKSIASSRGRNWGLQDNGVGMVAATRPILLECYPDRLVLPPESKLEQPQVIMLKPKTQDSMDELVTAVWKHAKTWGRAGRGLYWQPELVVDIKPGAADRYAEAKNLMADSGLEMHERAPAAANSNARPATR